VIFFASFIFISVIYLYIYMMLNIANIIEMIVPTIDPKIIAIGRLAPCLYNRNAIKNPIIPVTAARSINLVTIISGKSEPDIIYIIILHYIL